MWFGMQVVLSCATGWITYVATGPLQNAKHDLRFPLTLCLIFFTMATALEATRSSFIRKTSADGGEEIARGMGTEAGRVDLYAIAASRKVVMDIC